MLSRKIAATGAAALASTALFTSTAAAADSASSPRLVGGQPAPESVTFVASLMYDAPAHDVYDHMTCAGAVIAGRWIATAAQCVADLGIPGDIPAKDKTFHVRAGLDRAEGGATANVTGIFVNPHWTGEIKPPRATGDFVLLRLDRRLNVRTVPLAWRPPRAGDRVTTYSWGSDTPNPQPNPDDLPRMLQQLDLTVLPKSQCKDAGISDGEFCTSHFHHTGPAYGDAGGPAISYDKQGRPWFVGIDSHGGSSVPGESNTAFTDVPSYEDWVHDTIAHNS